ncbi:conjugal transfer protein [Streptomyces lydicus]|uniref:conjugal transfer protein n=1 Tax=Streptomyces lydicus TaxID=47763 RepID=UPI0036EB8E2E
MPTLLPRHRLDDPPPSAGGPRLRPLRHRRVAVVRVAALVALTCGPLSLASVWASSSRAAHPAVSAGAHQTAQPAAQPGQDPAGFAEVFLGLWLKGEPAGGRESAAQRAVQSMAPEVALPEYGGRAPRVGQVSAVRSVPVRSGAWSVTVAAELEASGERPVVRYYRVPVLFRLDHAGGASFVAAAPAQVPGPSAGRSAASPYTAEVTPGSALAKTVAQFLSAYLSGAGGTDRYLAPHVVLAPLDSSYVEVRTERVTSIGRSGGAVGGAGEQVRVRVQVLARDAQGAQWPLTYALRLATRDGRWEVRAMESGLEAGKEHLSSSKDGV